MKTNIFLPFCFVSCLWLVPAYGQDMDQTPAQLPSEYPAEFNNSAGDYDNSPHLFDSSGQFAGDLNDNITDPLSVMNITGAFGGITSPYSMNIPDDESDDNQISLSSLNALEQAGFSITTPSP